jgi:cytidine deaminase
VQQRPSPERLRTLLDAARQAASRAYAPYSGFQVGAALAGADGSVHLGCNVENAAYGDTICAERGALLRAVADGVRDFAVIAVVGPQDEACWPCGSCRQALSEFAPRLWVASGTPDAPEVVRLDELLPRAFGPADLEREA